jgi:DNA helicase-2/ATP-dependent DNA helicase PcrA
LEFDTVFIPGMAEGIFPLNRSISNPSELEEERRLCYVALTRARKHLYLSHSEYRKIYGSSEYRRPSRFLAEIPEELMDVNTSNEKSNPTTEQATPKRSVYEKRPKMLQTKHKNPKLSTDFGAGDKISHPAWGQGTIVTIDESGEDKIVTAAFAGLGIKKFILGYAKITKV